MTQTVGASDLPATIRLVSVDASGRWLAAGWMDVRRAPGVSLGYGAAFAIVSLALAIGLLALDLGSLILPLAGWFVLMAPLLAIVFYDISRRLESGERPSAGAVARASSAGFAQVSAMGAVLMLVFLVWTLLALVLFVLFYGQSPPPLDRFVEEILFSVRGGVFLALDRPVDVVTAILVSARAVRVNWRVMFGWAALIVLLTGAGFVTLFLGLAVVMPLLGHASWHAYRDVIEPH
ncbi:MAG: DUF2189 domain-containing protein [Alphaproteobacteria bacterium]|nr:DUF2189 domain-containing protein [Alphaproteobacteria bacterium]MBM3732875.1 DUF2189 domain-containing protein [Acidimicrobiia bacterium]